MSCATSPNASPSACPPSKKAAPAVAAKGLPLPKRWKPLNANLLNDALQRSGGNLTQASQELGMAKTTLFDKVKKYGLSH